jgi:hypothetical protein
MRLRQVDTSIRTARYRTSYYGKHRNTMGIHTLGRTDIPTTTANWIDIVKSCKHPGPFDAANLMFNVQWCYALECHEGDFTSSGLKLIHILDGKGNPHKALEDLRRRQKRAAAEALLAPS